MWIAKKRFHPFAPFRSAGESTMSATRPVCLALILLTGVIAWKPAVAASATLYVATNGVDAVNSQCLKANPCRTIVRAVAAANAGDMIEVAAGTYDGSVKIAKQLTIRGAGPAATIADGRGRGSVFEISGAVVSISGMRIQNGNAGDGGAIRNAGILRLEEVVLASSRAARGGGIFNDAQGYLFLAKVTIDGNTSTAEGGGLANLAGAHANLVDVTISNNKAAQGGGIANSGTISAEQTLISANTGGSFGGGIYNGGSLELRNATISGNKIDAGRTAAGGGGAGVATDRGGTTDLLNVTIADNTASGQSSAANGGGLYMGTYAIAVHAANTIVARNGAPQCAIARQPGIAKSLTGYYSIAGDDSCGFWALDFTVDPNDLKLGPLADNGGFNRTHALLPDSPAIDHGWNAICHARDQRGVARRTCDIGAFAYVAPAVAIVQKPVNNFLSSVSRGASSAWQAVIGFPSYLWRAVSSRLSWPHLRWPSLW
jgi:hypothetical protein